MPISTEHPYHVSGRCLNRDWFILPMPDVWALMEDYLYLVATVYGLKIHSFVLMSNHFHLLLRAPEGNLSEAMCYFMRETSREISRMSGRINQTWGAPHHKTLIGSHHYFLNAYKYVYRNPVRAGICNRVEAYPYSTLHGLCGLKPMLIPLIEDTVLFESSPLGCAIQWLNKASKPELEEEMRLALRRAKLEFKTSSKSGRESLLKTTLL